jgi:hypothetical protein
VLALIYAMALGADSVDDTDVLRAGRTRRLLGGWIPAPSTLGTFLRAFTFGHVRQLDAVLDRALARAWRAGAGPGDGGLVIDVDSFVGEVCGKLKQGAAFGYTKLLGYHPLLASRADTGEILHVRLRKGSAGSARGVLRFADELIARVERAGATGTKLLRADNGFWNKKLMARLEKAGWQYSISVRQQAWVPDAIAAIPETDWQPLEDYPDDGEAQIAQTMLGSQRLVVRRTRLIGAQAELWPDWRHFALLTNRTESLEIVEAEHRAHAVVELAIRDLKDQGLAHFPSGQFNANAAWTVIACLAHNLLRWTTLLGLPDTIIRTARTVRRRLLQIPGRLTRTARRWTLHLPARGPGSTTSPSPWPASGRSHRPPDAARRPLDDQPPSTPPRHTPSRPRTALRRLRGSVPSGSPPPHPPHSRHDSSLTPSPPDTTTTADRWIQA